jgi:Arc/MetJ-type ribon-helix-helix transcriptional regulator
MNVNLTVEIEERVREKLARGDYNSAEALVQEAVHRLIEEEDMDLESLRQRLQRADTEIERGEGLEFDENTTRHLAMDIRKRGARGA